MSVEANQDSNAEVVQPATQPDAQKTESPDWRAVRQKLKALEDQNRELQEKMQRNEKPQQEELSLSKEDLATVGTVEEVVKREARRIANEELHRQREEMFLERARAKFPDYDEVMSPEALSIFEQQEPDLAESFLSLSKQDKYKAAVASYKAIKGMGYHNKTSKKAVMAENQKKLEENASKPLSSAAVDRRPLAQAHKFMKEDYPSLWKEMQQYAKRA